MYFAGANGTNCMNLTVLSSRRERIVCLLLATGLASWGNEMRAQIGSNQSAE